MQEGGRLNIGVACAKFLFVITGIAGTSIIIEIRQATKYLLFEAF
jgi:hypothetical protein